MSDIGIETNGTEGSRRGQAKELIGQAGQTLKAEAQSFASAAQDRVRSEAQRGAQVGAKTLGDFANAVRRAGDELDQADQSPASRLVRQAADGLESLSRNLADKEPGDILNAVRDFGRRNPAAFIGGAVLVGLALGRFARASEPDHPAGLSDTDLTFDETDAYEGPAVAQSGGLAAPPADDLGGMGATPLADTSSTLGLGDGVSSLDDDVEAAPGEVGGDLGGSTTSPHTGTR